MVDEYVRGVEEWRERRHPGDAELRRVRAPAGRKHTYMYNLSI